MSQQFAFLIYTDFFHNQEQKCDVCGSTGWRCWCWRFQEGNGFFYFSGFMACSDFLFFSFSSSVHVNTLTMFFVTVVVSQVTRVTSRWQERTTFPLPERLCAERGDVIWRGTTRRVQCNTQRWRSAVQFSHISTDLIQRGKNLKKKKQIWSGVADHLIKHTWSPRSRASWLLNLSSRLTCPPLNSLPVILTRSFQPCVVLFKNTITPLMINIFADAFKVSWSVLPFLHFVYSNRFIHS